jgi:5'-nucleotidase
METYRDAIARLVKHVTTLANYPPNTLLNVNLPPVPASEAKGVKVTSLGSRYFSDSLMRAKDPWGREIFWIGGGSITWTGGIESDHAATHEGFISVTPLQMDLTNYGLIETVRGWSLEG